MNHAKPAAFEFSESVATVVGGTAGVGLAAACKYVEAGVRRIAIVGRNAERGEAAAATLRALPSAPEVLFIAADANRVSEARRIVDTVTAKFGALDILLNSTVGTAGPQLLKDIPAEELEAILVQQSMGPILMSHAVLPTMIAQNRGVILNIASDAAKLATPGESVIGAAMAAIVMFTRTLAIEAKRNNIRVNALTPSLIQGTLTHARMQENEFSQKLFAKAAKMAHLGVAEAEDLADLAVFLASPQASKITGQAISANGGISAA